MQTPLVSILIPYKNTAPFLAECLQSICDQTYTQWEVIAINDHSSDSSKEILETYVSKDTRFNTFDNDSKGIIPALQKAYKHCKGDYITRMDSDDIMTPHKLEVMVASLKKHGAKHLAVGQVQYFSKQGISDGYERYEKWLNALTEKGSNFSEVYKECVIPSPAWMLHRQDFEACGAFNSNRYPEDYDLTFRFRKQGLKCIPCTKVLHLWRDYDTRTSRTHEHYAQNYFLDIKTHYFLDQDFDPQRPLVVWGAGSKGKTIAQLVLQKDIPFHWLCDNPNKIGKIIYDCEMKHFSYLSEINNAQSIITVANEDAQIEIRKYLSALGHQEMTDYFFFC